MIPIKLLETREQGTFDHDFLFIDRNKSLFFVVIYTVEGERLNKNCSN